MAVDHNNPQSRDEEILIATIDEKEYDKAPQSRMEELLLELKETIEEGGGGGGTTNYNNLSNQPQVNGETLIGDKTGAELGLVDAEEGKGLSTNDYDDTEKAAVAAATSAISAIKDGTDIDSFGDVEVALLDKADTSDLGTAAAKDSTNVVTSGSTDLVESGAVKDAIDTAVSRAYHHAGTKTVAQLTHDLLIAANEGDVYEITDSGTTTSDFMEGIGKPIKEGDNVGIARVSEGVYKFDLLSGFVDTTNFVQKSQTSGLLKNDGTVDTTIQGDVATLKSGLTTLDTEVNGDAVEYPYADVITIEDAIPANVADCNVKIEPVQDLHGQSVPYVGGAGKNKLPLVLADIKALNTTGTWSGNSYTLNNVTYTINTDVDGNIVNITVNTGSGGASGDCSFYLYNGNFTAGNYIINGITGGNESIVFLGIISSDVYKCTNGDLSVIIGNTINCFITTKQGYSVDKIITPMIRLATEADATFAPYTNICPITGHTEASVQRDGKNLFDVSTVELHKSINDVGIVYPTENYNLSDYIRVSGTKLIVSGDNKDKKISFGFYDKNKEWFDSASSISVNTAVTIPNGTAYVRFDVYKDSENIQLELGQTATDYEPYAGKTYTIALGSTIYGGTVDFDSGVMTVDRAVVDLGTLTWNKGSSSVGVRFYTTGLNSLMSHVTGGNELIKAICSDYARGTSNGSYTGINGEIADAGQFTAIVDNRYDDYTAEEFKTAMDGVQLCYELATPFTVQLTPQQIQLLKGQNTLTASTGQISVTVNGVSGSIGAVQEQVNDHEERIETVESGLTNKQNKTDNTLQTTDKTIVGGINELKSGLTNYENQNNLNLEVANRKNLLPMKVSTIKSINTSGTWSGDTYTINGMTFTVTGDAQDKLTSVTLNDKATANCYFMLNTTVVFDVDSFNSYTPSNKYKAITGTGSGGDVNSYSVVYQASNHETYIRVAANYTSDNITLTPMITELWVTDATFAPYIPSVNARLDAVESGLTNVNSNLAILNGETGVVSGNSNVEIIITSGDLLWLFTYRDNAQYTSAYIVGGTWTGTPSVAKIVESANITVEGLAGTPPYNTVKITNANSGEVNYKFIKIST